MERTEIDHFVGEGNGHPRANFEDGEVSSVMSSNFYLDHVGQVTLTFNSDSLSWKMVEPLHNGESTCLGINLKPDAATEIKMSDTYAVELINLGLIHMSCLAQASRCPENEGVEMYRFTVHGTVRTKAQPSLLSLVTYTFGNKSLETCQMWVNHLNTSLGQELGRPHSLLVFINPRSGKGKGYRTWESVRTIFLLAKVETKVIVTERAGHAFDVMSSITNGELSLYDGVVTVGGDGFFNEILNGFLSKHHKAPKPPIPYDIFKSVGDTSKFSSHNSKETVFDTPQEGDDQFPLLSNPEQNGTEILNSRTEESSLDVDSAAKDIEPSYSDGRFRFGIIPAGSTDAIVICTTGTRDSTTSALQIVLGKRVHLDIAQVVRWKTTPTSEIEPTVRYAASFAGYGFYGDVITESEKLRWMGPRRYDYAGTRVFLRHRSYEAEVEYLDIKAEDVDSASEQSQKASWIQGLCCPNVQEKSKCRVNCKICGALPMERGRGDHHRSTTPYSRPEEAKWLRSKGRFLSIGAAVISCRNERAPDGLVADAHLADGFLHLILIRDCPHASYLWHLTQLARKGGNPLNFKFVEHHKTPAFTFTSFGEESVWNVDGEIFPAHQLSAQVFRGLICLFASGPEV